MVNAHTGNPHIVPEDMQDVPVKEPDGCVVKVERGGFKPFLLLRKKEVPDILAGKLLLAFAHIVQKTAIAQRFCSIGSWRYLMNLFIGKIVSSILQIILFVIVPFIWWFVTARNHQKFSQWIGLKKIDGGKRTFVSIIIVSISFLVLGGLTLYGIRDIDTATSEFASLGVDALPAIVIYAAFNTAFPEEILFRGFLLKRVANKFGFNIANLTQALLFGLLHGVMFFSLVGAIKAILILFFTSVIAWLMGYINEKISNGSIIPSWIIHTISNLFSGICAAFSII